MMRSSRTKSTVALGKANKKKKGPGLVPIAEIPITNDVPVGSVRTKFSKFGGRVLRSDEEVEEEWEVRPGGMLVQNRDPDVNAFTRPLPIRVRIKYGAASHEIHILPHASFGELKKLVSAIIGVHPDDQKIMFKKKTMENASFLDISGVKDRTKLLLLDDPIGKAKRVLQTINNSKLEKATKLISTVALDVDNFATKVSQLESLITFKGNRVAEKEVGSLIDKLMNLLVKLDAVIVSDGELKTQRGNLVRRVQKYVETLDELAIKNSTLKHVNSQVADQQIKKKSSEEASASASASSPVKWETFDLLSSMPPSTTATAESATTTTATSASTAHIPRFDWELF